MTSTASWIVRRWMPVVALGLAAGAVAGAFRGAVGFLVGIQGMLLLGVLGYVAGRMGRSDPERFWTFAQRIWLSLTIALVVGVVEVVVLSVVRAGPHDEALEWLGQVTNGYVSESGASLGQTGRVVRGHVLRLTGGWWVFFTALDLVLGAFVFLAMTVVGLRAPRTEEAPRAAGSRAAALLFVAVLAFASVASGALVLWQRHESRSDVLSMDNFRRNQRLVGSWVIASGDGLRDIPAPQRRFSVKLLGMDSIAALADDQAFLISLDPVGRRGERFEGRLDPGPEFAWFPLPPTSGFSAGFRVAVVVAADAQSMDLVVERRTGDKRAFTARRAADESSLR
jgi:hypothetical protein